MPNTPKINPEHPRIKSRTSKQQTYRDNLAKTLKSDRTLGPSVGRFMADERLKHKQESCEYILAKYGYTVKWAEKLVEEYPNTVLMQIEKFPEFDHNILANKLRLREIARSLNILKWLDNKIAKKLIKHRYRRDVAFNIKSFRYLDEEDAKVLIEKWYLDQVKLNIENIKKNEE